MNEPCKTILEMLKADSLNDAVVADLREKLRNAYIREGRKTERIAELERKEALIDEAIVIISNLCNNIPGILLTHKFVTDGLKFLDRAGSNPASPTNDCPGGQNIHKRKEKK